MKGEKENTEAKNMKTENHTQAALAAAAIKKELKAAFPETTFRVRSENFSMGNSVHIKWTDGPTEEQVEKITSKYQYGHFDGMIDMYEDSNMRDDIPQSKYVMASRELSDEMMLSAAKAAQAHYGELENLKAPETREECGKSFEAFHQWYNWAQIAWSITKKVDLRNCTRVIEDPTFECGSMFDGFKGA